LGFTLPGPAAATHAKPSRWRSTSLRVGRAPPPWTCWSPNRHSPCWPVFRAGFRVQDSRFMVLGFGFWVLGSVFKVWGVRGL